MHRDLLQHTAFPAIKNFFAQQHLLTEFSMTQSEAAEEGYEQGAGPGAPIPVNQLIVSIEVHGRHTKCESLIQFLRVSLVSQSEMSSLYKREVSTR